MLFSSNAIKAFLVHHDLDACHIFYNRSLYLYRVLLLYKVQCQVEVKLKFRILYRLHAFNSKYCAWGKLLQL